jgi:hypothetical protein
VQIVGRLDAGKNALHGLCFRPGLVISSPSGPAAGFIAAKSRPSQGLSPGPMAGR